MSIDKAYDSWSELYDSNVNRTRDLDFVISQKILANNKYSKILELGCGTGKNTQWLIKLCEEITAVDFSENMLAIAKNKINSDKVVFKKMDLLSPWNQEHNYYNLACCNLVLEHIKDLDSFFQKTAEILDDNGHFFISELHPFKQYVGSKAKYETDEGTQELEVYTHNISDFTNAAKTAGFKLLQFDEWFDQDSNKEIPRLISFLFEKK